MKKQYLVPGAALLLLVAFAVAAYLYDAQKAREITEMAQQNSAVLERSYSPKTGPRKAMVTIVEFFDPACGTCRAFHPFVKQMLEANPGQIRLVLRYTPFHQGSDYVVRMLEAARVQGRFWETLDLIYEAQPDWAAHHNPDPQRIWPYLTNSGLDLQRLKVDMERQDFTVRMQQDMADARQLMVTKTPSFFVNGRPLVRFGYETLQALVESELRKHY